MTRVCIVCEGPTEAEFVKACLEPHLRGFGLVVYPSLIKSRPGKPGGGNVSVERVVRHIRFEYANGHRISTLLDYYGFYRATGRPKLELENEISNQLSKKINNFDSSRVLPYIQQYEFEGLLFSDVEQFAWVMDGWNETVKRELVTIRALFKTPEDINNNRKTAPSKRILQTFGAKNYNKRAHGPIIAQEIGLERIRQECPQFSEWVSRLEAWGKAV